MCCSDVIKTSLVRSSRSKLFNIQKDPKTAKWTNHFVSDKKFQKGQMATMAAGVHSRQSQKCVNIFHGSSPFHASDRDWHTNNAKK